MGILENAIVSSTNFATAKSAPNVVVVEDEFGFGDIDLSEVDIDLGPNKPRVF